MTRSLIISENVNLAALMDRGKAVEFFLKSSDFSLGDIYSARVENILPSIDAVFVNLGHEKMGFLHASDIPGKGPLSERIWPRQKLLIQIVKEPTGNKGPRVSTDITLIGRFFVLTTEHENIVMSRRISSLNERARLKSIAALLKPPVGFGLVIRTEAMGATDQELEEDFRELFLERWKYIIDQFESQRRPGLLFSDSKDLLYKTLRDVFHDGVDTVAVDNEVSMQRAKHYLELWSHNPPTVQINPTKELLQEHNVLAELKSALSDRVELPSGGYIHIQPTEALTVIDVNSGKFTSSKNPGETILKTNLEAATEAARQLRLRNIGGVIVIDFIDMDSKFDRLKVLEHFEKLLEGDPAHPQIGRLSDLGLVELTRHRQEKSLSESLGHCCEKCNGTGWIFPIFEYIDGLDSSTQSTENSQTQQGHFGHSQTEVRDHLGSIVEGPDFDNQDNGDGDRYERDSRGPNHRYDRQPHSRHGRRDRETGFNRRNDTHKNRNDRYSRNRPNGQYGQQARPASGGSSLEDQLMQSEQDFRRNLESQQVGQNEETSNQDTETLNLQGQNNNYTPLQSSQENAQEKTMEQHGRFENEPERSSEENLLNSNSIDNSLDERKPVNNQDSRNGNHGRARSSRGFGRNYRDNSRENSQENPNTNLRENPNGDSPDRDSNPVKESKPVIPDPEPPSFVLPENSTKEVLPGIFSIE